MKSEYMFLAVLVVAAIFVSWLLTQLGAAWWGEVLP